jgi:hypothetical protein
MTYRNILYIFYFIFIAKFIKVFLSNFKLLDGLHAVSRVWFLLTCLLYFGQSLREISGFAFGRK